MTWKWGLEFGIRNYGFRFELLFYKRLILGLHWMQRLVFCESLMICPYNYAGFLGRPRIDKTSDLAMRIIKAQETKRLNAYVEAGCVKTDDSIQNLNKCKCL